MDLEKQELINSVYTLLALNWRKLLRDYANEVTGGDMKDERGINIRTSLGLQQEGVYTGGLMARLQEDLLKRGKITQVAVRRSIDENINEYLIPDDKLRQQLKADLLVAYNDLQQRYFGDPQQGAAR